MTISKSRVTVHSKLTAVPHTPVEPGKTYPLPVLDHAMGVHTVHIIFYYKEHKPLDTEKYFDLGSLRVALGEALSYYPQVTGRLQKDDCGNWQVKCNDAGVRILKATVNCTFEEWLRSAEGHEEKDLAVWENIPEDPNIWSPFRIQLNDFTGGGLAVGLSCPHMLADPTCATVLMKTWSDICQKICISHTPFFHPPALRVRANYNTDTKSIKTYEAKSKLKPLPAPVNMSTATFLFSDTAIKKCLAEVKSKCPDATPFHLLSGVFSVSIKNEAETPVSSLSVCIDFRKNIHAPIPYAFFGNALHFSTVSIEPSKMAHGGWQYMTQIIHDHVSAIDEEEYCSVIDWLESKKGGENCAEPFRMYGPELTCVNLEHIPAFAAVLDDMKPTHVSYHIGNVEGEGLILVLPSPEGGLGRTVMVTLPQDKICNLLKDLTISHLEPTMLVSGR